MQIARASGLWGGDAEPLPPLPMAISPGAITTSAGEAPPERGTGWGLGRIWCCRFAARWRGVRMAK